MDGKVTWRTMFSKPTKGETIPYADERVTIEELDDAWTRTVLQGEVARDNAQGKTTS